MDLVNRIIEHYKCHSIGKYRDHNKQRNPAYVINDDIALLVKSSSPNMSGNWYFGVNYSHRQQFKEIAHLYRDHTYVAWICTDRVCLLNTVEYSSLTEPGYSVSLSLNNQWRIYRYGRTWLTIPRYRFPSELFSKNVLSRSLTIKWTPPDVAADVDLTRQKRSQEEGEFGEPTELTREPLRGSSSR
jgi:hypothetical protein